MNRKNITIIAVIVVIAGLILLIIGLNYDIPSKKFYFSSIEEYVGGDAYNAMIEASLSHKSSVRYQLSQNWSVWIPHSLQ